MTKLSKNSKKWRTYDPRKQSALLIIDMQNYFLDESSHAFVPDGMAILDSIRTIRAEFRDRNQPVIYTRFAVAEGEDDPISRWWADSVSEGSQEAQLHAEVQPLEGEKIIRKHAYSAFFDTDLEEYLRTNGVENLLITGVLTNLCVETTARDAFDRGFSVFIPVDSVATYSEEMHVSSLKNLCYGFAVPVCTGDLCPE